MKALLLGAVLALAASAALSAEIPANVTVKIGFDVGTSNDQAGRLLAGYIGRYLPGEPRVGVENVPGASGAKLAHQMVGLEPRDGSVLGLVSTDLVRSHVVDPESMDFDPGTLKWVGALIAPAQVCVTNKRSPVSLSQLADTGVTFGATVQNSANYAQAAVVRSFKRGTFRIVTGFKNEIEMMAALDRGEINGYCGQTYSTYQREGRSDAQLILGGFGSPDRLAELGILNLAEGLTGTDAAAVNLLIVATKAFYTFALPTGTPHDVVAEYRAAFDAAMNDPALRQDMQDLYAEVSPKTGAEVEGFVAAVVGADPAVVARARELVQ